MSVSLFYVIDICSTWARGLKPVANLYHGTPSAMSSDANYADLLPTLLSARASVDIVTHHRHSEGGGTSGH